MPNIPDSASVPVKSPFESKINWTQVGGLALNLATVFVSGLPPQQQVMAGLAIQAAQSIGTIVFRTWFNKSVTPQSL